MHKTSSSLYYSLGVMSGTSLDGVDLCLSKFMIQSGRWEFEILKSETIPYNLNWKEKLSSAISLSWSDLLTLDFEYGNFLGTLISDFCEKHQIKPQIIGSHGHTVHHKPELGYTIQIGNGNCIAKITGVDTVFDFRSKDVSLKGQGAPLVPIGDQLLFPEYKCCINLGGFANLSVKSTKHDIIAYDICALNVVLNYLSSKDNKEYDEDGIMASKGNLIPELYEKLNKIPFYKSRPPKSLGIEWVNENIFPIINNFLPTHKLFDIINTYTTHAANEISKALPPNNHCLITGGGAYNKYLISTLSDYYNGEIIIPDDKLISFKEALIFAFLGVLRIRNEVNVLASVTGAKENSVSGLIARKSK
ncbi:anhydro-N-acetylmuramic acid kinase [Marinigracilibium pacificum]|uniref:Anhydro-N-acetylmuramic acid kinase n=1 Tax=Marinigracilibium pacificum TaxID=2729599 RepID=A0A848IX94_9BACT|nr:anhydro-N-acetylmuramic acid kinase [Marinigracilibium pacificum]NMM46880.1 anhydro-N-acetylmuramic acid kinase [Marinigracilibium pacificum]